MLPTLGSLDPHAQRILQRANQNLTGLTAWPSERVRAINDAVVALKDWDILPHLDILFVLASHGQANARINWIEFGTAASLSPVNTPVFTPDRGYAGDNATSYLLQNDASIGVWSLSSGQDSASLFGTGTASSSFITPRNLSDNMAYRINQSGTTSAVTGVTDGAGLFAVERTGSNATEAFINGESRGTSTIAANVRSSVSLNIGRVNNAFHGAQVALIFAGGALGAQRQAAFYKIMRDHLASIGVPVQ